MPSSFTPSVTIVTVCYNALPLLPKCITSVHQQKLSSVSVEHIIIDGASTDGTREYLEQALLNKEISSYISEPDKGIYDAMNKGIEQAKGTVIAFLNSDDEFLPGAIEALASPIIHKNADYTMGAALIEDQGKIICKRLPDLDNAYLGAICCHQALFCKTEILRRLGGFDGVSFPTIADGDLMAKLVSNEYIPHIVRGEHVLFREGGVSAGCVITAADQFIQLIEKYRFFLYKKVLSIPDFSFRLSFDIREKTDNLKKCSKKGLDFQALLAVLTHMRCDLQLYSAISGMPNKSRGRLRRKYWQYRILQKICTGTKKDYYKQQKILIRQQLKSNLTA